MQACARVTPVTARLLQHWARTIERSYRPFFCQIEAVETAIWLAEVAPDGQAPDRPASRSNAEANPDLFRLAIKLATGSGKTTVMAMLIAWQTVNAVRRPSSTRLPTRFLIVTPGITDPRSVTGAAAERIRELLQPPASWYRTDMLRRSGTGEHHHHQLPRDQTARDAGGLTEAR